MAQIESSLKIVRSIKSYALDIEYASDESSYLKDIRLVSLEYVSASNIRSLVEYCPNLDTLKLYGFTDWNSILEVGKAKNLKSLRIIPDAIDLAIKHLSKIGGLKQLDIYYQTDDDLNMLITQLPSLTNLTINSPSFSPLQVQSLSTLSKLKSFKLYFIDYTTPQILQAIFKHLKQLTSLTFQQCFFVNEKQLLQVQNMPLLETFNLTSSYVSSGLMPQLFSHYPPSVRETDLNTNGLDKSTFDILLERCPNMQSIKLNNCEIDNGSIQVISKKGKNLKRIEIQHNLLTLQGFQILIANLPDLVVLNIGKSYTIPQSCLKYISNLTSLLSLSLQSLELTNSSLMYLISLKNLRSLNIRGSLISSSLLSKLLINLKNIKKLLLNDVHKWNKSNENKSQLIHGWIG